MKNNSFNDVIRASVEDRRGLFLATATRLGAPIQNIEKDFWVSWVLDLLFNTRRQEEPRLLFKGGTSLSKAHALISRFSEDIDITVFREDLKQNKSLEELELLSGKQQRKYLEAIKVACQSYIANQLKPHLEEQIEIMFQECSQKIKKPTVSLDSSDSSQQTLLISYQSVASDDNYVTPTVKIEGGAKSALDPHQFTTIRPYIAEEMKDKNFDISNVITINAERTFWDKIIILHGIRRWYDKNKVLRQDGHRFSRHYYDVYQLIHSSIYSKATSNLDLALDCSRHAKMFFNSSGLDLVNAKPGSLSLLPTTSMLPLLKRDYQAMSGMIFGDIPVFEEIIDSIKILEGSLNELKS
jgi:hypothetical protein